MKKFIYLLLSLVIITSCKSKRILNIQHNISYYHDGLDEIGKNTKQNNRLKDIYRAYYILNSCIEMDLNFSNELNSKHHISQAMYHDGHHKKYIILLDKELNPYIKKCNLLKNIKLNDKKLKIIAFNCVNRLQKLFNSIKPNRETYFRYTEFSYLLLDRYNRKGALEKYLLNNYDISTFVNLSEKTYWELNNKSNYIKDTRYDSYKKKMIHKQYDRAEELLRKIIVETNDFQEQSIYKIQLADQLISRDISNRKTTHFLESDSIYKTILNEKKYSLYLFEAWVKWRSLNQAMIGFSDTDRVPNRLYEQMRLNNIKTVFSHLQKYPNDKMAINYFLTLSSHEILINYSNVNNNEEEFFNYFEQVNL